MQISSQAFTHNGPVPSKYTCDGEDLSPPLEISEVPVEAKSLVLVVDDPDAPRGDWVHWLVWNIAPDTTQIKENSVPLGASEGTTDFGLVGWGGPCPPSGTHRYFFKLFALNAQLNLPNSTQKAELISVIEPHTLAKTELIGLYQRTR